MIWTSRAVIGWFEAGQWSCDPSITCGQLLVEILRAMARTKKTVRDKAEGRVPTLAERRQQSRGVKRISMDDNPGNSRNTTAGQNRRKHRKRPGTLALQEIRKFQKCTDLLMRKLPFQRLVKEIARDFVDDIRFKPEAIKALQVG